MIFNFIDIPLICLETRLVLSLQNESNVNAKRDLDLSLQKIILGKNIFHKNKNPVGIQYW